MNPNFIFLKTHFNITETAFLELKNISKFRRIKKHDTIAKVGELPSSICMLTSGIMRAYFNSECGKEYTKNIFPAYSFVGSLTALIQNKPSKLTYEALTDCEMIELNFKTIKKLCQKNIEVSNLYNNVLEYVFTNYERMQFEFLSLDATQRYLKLREKLPNVDRLIPQYQIASYLNITPVQLSRIRKKMK